MAQLDALTPEQIIASFESKVDDSLDIITEYELANDVKDAIEADDEWAVLKTVDESQTASASDTYLTFHPLPGNFGLPAQGGIYVGNDIIPYLQIPLEKRQQYQSTTHRYYLDMANNQYALCGSSNPGGTIHFFYQKSSPALAAGGPGWIFPPRFHPIIPKLMAEMYPAYDQPDKSRAWDDRWNTFSTKNLEIMRRWNARLLLQGHQNNNVPIDISADPNIIDIDSGGMNGTMYV